MPIASLALALLLAGGPQTEAPMDRNTPVRCNDERLTCRDGCSMDLGSSVATRDALVTCLDRCDERREVCLLRVVAKQREQAALEKPHEEKDAGVEPPRPSGPVAPYTLPATRYPGREDAADAGTPDGGTAGAGTSEAKKPEPAQDAKPVKSGKKKVKKAKAGAAP